MILLLAKIALMVKASTRRITSSRCIAAGEAEWWESTEMGLRCGVCDVSATCQHVLPWLADPEGSRCGKCFRRHEKTLRAWKLYKETDRPL